MSDIILNTFSSSAVVEIVLHRPHRRNALTGPMVEELINAFERINEDADISVVILRGAEGSFCSGLDLKEFGAGPSPALPADFPTRWRQLHGLIFNSPKILIGALEGAAINAGAALALACDLLIVGHSSLLQVGEIQRGMAAPMNLAWLRIRHSEAMAARVILVGEPISGVELSTMGLAHACVDDSHVLTHCSELAHRLATFDVAGVIQMKRALREAYAEGRLFQDFLA